MHWFDDAPMQDLQTGEHGVQLLGPLGNDPMGHPTAGDLLGVRMHLEVSVKSRV